MRKNTFSKKLELNKKTITNLEAVELDSAKGGTLGGWTNGMVSCGTYCFKPISLCIC